ncbi:MAG: fibronectin type III domain-containing protein, partial [Saprospiraceae bacterium]
TTPHSLVEINLPPTTSSFNLDNLLPTTIYECFLFAENTSTAPTDLDIITFQTPTNNCINSDSSNAVSNLQASQIECQEVVLSWTPPTNREVAYYNLVTQPGNINLSFRVLTTPIAFKINNLLESTNYSFSLAAVAPDGQVSSNQIINATTLATNQCDDDDDDDGNENCNPDCPTYICIKDDWINDITATEHLDARRLFDESELGNPTCGENGIPVSNWGEEYTPGLNIPPIIAIVDLQQMYSLDAIHLFDIESDGDFRVEYQNSNGDWVIIADFFTAAYRKWHELNNLNLSVQYLRFTKLHNSAKIAEVAIFGTPLNN